MNWVWAAVAGAGYLGAMVGFVIGWCARVAIAEGNRELDAREQQATQGLPGNEQLGIGA